MVIDVIKSVGSPELNGRLVGWQHFAKLCDALAKTPPGEVALLDFASLKFVTGSWINACIFPLIRWSSDEQHDLYPVVTRLDEIWFDEFRVVADLTNESILVASNDLSSGELIGVLEPAQLEALDHVMRIGSVTGAGLERHSEGRVKATAWNNRLKMLNIKRLVKRISQGREQIYCPIVKELRMGDNYLRQQAANHQNQRDLATTELEVPQLLGRPEIVEIVYTIEPDNGQTLTAGAILYIQPLPDSDLLVAVEGHRRVGVVRGENAAALRAVLTEGGQARIVTVQVFEVAPISGVGYARILKNISA